MDDKEAIEILKAITPELDKEYEYPHIEQQEQLKQLIAVIDHLQRRVDIVDAAESDLLFDESQMPHIYTLVQELRRMAHVELDYAITFPTMNDCFSRALHYGRLARKNLQSINDWKEQKEETKEGIE